MTVPKKVAAKKAARKPDLLAVGDTLEYGVSLEVKGKWFRAATTRSKRAGETDDDHRNAVYNIVHDTLDKAIKEWQQ